MKDISNQYAAMPSMHIGWSTWCAVAMWPLLRRRWQRAVVFLYPLATLFCIIVTANHYWIDGLGGLLCFGGGTLAGWGLHRWNQNRLDRKHLAAFGLHEPVRRGVDGPTIWAGIVPGRDSSRNPGRSRPEGSLGRFPPRWGHVPVVSRGQGDHLRPELFNPGRSRSSGAHRRTSEDGARCSRTSRRCSSRRRS